MHSGKPPQSPQSTCAAFRSASAHRSSSASVSRAWSRCSSRCSRCPPACSRRSQARGQPDRAIVLRGGAIAEALSTITRDDLVAIEAAPGSRAHRRRQTRDIAGSAAVGESAARERRPAERDVGSRHHIDRVRRASGDHAHRGPHVQTGAARNHRRQVGARSVRAPRDRRRREVLQRRLDGGRPLRKPRRRARIRSDDRRRDAHVGGTIAPYSAASP